jgi:hypothetical protein
LLHLGGIVLAVTRSGSQAGKAQTMEQIIHSRHGILDAEFLAKDALDILRPQRADAVAGGGTGQETFSKRGLFRWRQLAGATALVFGIEPLQAPIPIRIHPQLHAPSAAGQDLGDLGSTTAFQGQHHGAVAVSWLGVPFLTAALSQLFEILGVMGFDPHGTVPPVSARVCHRQMAGATLF